MSIRFEAVTTISCDGPEGRSCPHESVLRFHAGQFTATRKATLMGWEFSEEVLCPACQKKPAEVAFEDPKAPVISLFGPRPVRMSAA